MRPNVTSEKVKVFQQTEWPKLDKLFSSKLLQHILALDHHILQWTGKYKSRNKRKIFRFEFPSISINLRQALKSIEILYYCVCTFVYMILICAVCVLDIFRFITQQFSFLLLHQKQSSETEKTNWWEVGLSLCITKIGQRIILSYRLLFTSDQKIYNSFLEIFEIKINIFI